MYFYWKDEQINVYERSSLYKLCGPCDRHTLLLLQQLVHIFITGHETMKYFKMICYIAV